MDRRTCYDPFNSSHVAYTTGATVYATDELEQADVGKPIKWKPWVDGVEETAVLMLTSPSQGPHLMSGIGDIGGGVHDDLARSPAVMFNGSFLPSTLTIDYAGVSPNVMVRSGEPPKTPKGQENALPTSLAFSTDFGQTWQSLIAPSFQLKAANGAITRRRFDDNSAAAIEPSADGGTLVVMTPVPVLTRDHGKSWSLTKGLPPGARVIADRVDPKRSYAIDLEKRIVLASTDGSATFSSLDTVGLPPDTATGWPTWPGAAWPLMATPGRAGDLWLRVRGLLYHSGDGGASFEEVHSDLRIEALAFGKPPPGKDYPALFAIAWKDQLHAVWRSGDAGKTWVRINDVAHEYGRRFRCIAGDPRVFGRVYVGTDGRGIVYGDAAK